MKTVFACVLAMIIAFPVYSQRTVGARQDSIQLAKAYAAAIEAAKVPRWENISRELVPISRHNPDLSWNAQKTHVLMVTWSKSWYYQDTSYKKGYAFSLYGNTWVSAFPFADRFLTDWGKTHRCDSAAMGLRINQMLGMPPTATNNVLLYFWVRPQDMFRPCSDPEIYDGECVVQIPELWADTAVHYPSMGTKAPWSFCDDPRPPGPASGLPLQEQRAFSGVQQSHLNWMCSWWHNSYDPPALYSQFPWTALGYTYDWGPETNDHVGMSEFVVLGGAKVIFEKMVFPANQFCGHGASDHGTKPGGR